MKTKQIMKKIILYHYSDKDFKNFINPSYYGHNYFTHNDCQITTIKRAFYYTDPKRAEYLLQGSKYLYITEIKSKDIYNITEDKQGYLKRCNGDIDLALRKIKRNYRGVIYNVGYDIVNLFNRAKIKDCKTLTKAF